MSKLTPSNDQIDFPIPEVTIDRLVLERIRRYVGQCSTEISGFGFATQTDGCFHVMDARVCKQDAVSSAHTDINKDALNQLMFEWKDREGVIVWWHSHVDMETFWSSQDVKTIMNLGKNGMCLAIVFNKRHQHRCALSFKMHVPFKNDPQCIMIDEIPLTVTVDTPAETVAAWDKELAEALPPKTAMTALADRWEDQYYGQGYLREEMTAWDPSEFWADNKDGEANDCNWRHGSHWIDSVGKWRKSFEQRQKEKSEKIAISASSTHIDSLHQARRAYAANDEDILHYWPIQDEYELVEGTLVDAEWYIQTAGDASFRGIDLSGLSLHELESFYKINRKAKEAIDAGER